MKATVALIGGFLGAGKTTLILAAARELQREGIRVGVVLNDQGDDLVDTHLVRSKSVDASQVSGGCFCCRFPDLLDALAELSSARPEIIFAEAVGSCTDIAATTLRPLLRDYPTRYRVAPLSVLLHTIPMDPDLRYLHDQQLAEADLVLSRDPAAPPGARHVDAVTGEGVAEWLAEILAPGAGVALHPLNLDYTRYAQAEAALAWLNARVTVSATPAISPAMLIGPLLDRLSAAIPKIVHLKLFTQSDSGYLKAALTASNSEPEVEGALDASPARDHEILLNLRALGDPAELQATVEREFAALPARLTWHGLKAFRPAVPIPFHRP
jgi:hypothetical protein